MTGENSAILVTGGAGYIGATIVRALSDNGYAPIVLDNLTAGDPANLRDVQHVVGDVRIADDLDAAFQLAPRVEAVIHCAALVSVPDSWRRPAEFESVNVEGTRGVLDALRRHGCNRLLFSSSAAVYGDHAEDVLSEILPLRPTSPYGRTKEQAEKAIAEVVRVTNLRAILFRYFNPIGADPLLRTGPLQGATTVLSRMLDAEEREEPFRITGTTLSTPDGTGVRDYVHVWDLAMAHIAGLEKLAQPVEGELLAAEALNLGTGTGTSVLELVQMMRHITGTSVEIEPLPVRAGDIEVAIADTRLAGTRIGWQPQLTLERAISDAIAWRKTRERLPPGT